MFLFISILAALVIFIVTANDSWENVLSSRRNQVVFEGRVKDYGAYQLRREQPRNLFIALLLSTGMVSAIFIVGLGGHPSKSGLVHAAPKELWTQIFLPPIEREVETPETLPQESTSPATEAAAAAGSTDEGTSSEVEITTETSNPIQTEQLTHPAGTEDGAGIGIGGNEHGSITRGTGESNGAGTENSSFDIRDWAEIMPTFPGGEEAMKRFIGKRVSFSVRERKSHVEGILYIGFVVNADGSISDVQALNSLQDGQDITIKAIKAVQGMPRWSPGRNGDKPVRVRMVMPIKLRLD